MGSKLDKRREAGKGLSYEGTYIGKKYYHNRLHRLFLALQRRFGLKSLVVGGKPPTLDAGLCD
ncbi:hypothetical protein GCM10011375_20980 [Hymenobacter qilianensis]|uniref:Uncharacterized protein n=1 Tax=Hymenobacter qilianensis TaxID=1385715 RepID=A0ACB5PRQ6_9BACT|nr:hypothetical protein GCM10011375_20980 [Hymenobacter qilianensis]